MENKLFEYIKDLSLKDKKTLSQKALKVSEESGELAKVVLPFENAAGTTHRFIEKERIFEESIDVVLTAISVAYDLGYSHEDIEDMMWRKSEKWHGIQAKEEKVEYPIPYEIHVTISMAPDKVVYDEQVKMFKDACKVIGVKPIVLDLENNGKSVMKDVMTSSHYIGNNTSAFLECNRISCMLEDYGFTVARRKIETVPWHPAAPSEVGDEMPKDCYFEAHIGCVISLEQKDILNSISKSNDSHLSRNFFKKLENGKFVNMITLRKKKGIYSEFLESLEKLKSDLDVNKIEYEKVITEFSIYDTKLSHDYLWLKKEQVEA